MTATTPALADAPDPFALYPSLRGKIIDPMTSFFRSFQPSDLDERMKAMGRPDDWRYQDADRNRMRMETLAGRTGQDIWVFAYGSLMWDPAFRFAEVRLGSITGHARRFYLKDTFGARGQPDAPGLMAALDEGPSCTGLAFRIAALEAEVETEVVWRREMLGPLYKPAFVTVETDFGPVEALTFMADRTSPLICPGLTREEQVRYIATGRGFLGSSREYLENIAAQFAALGIADEEVTGLLADVRAYPAD
jgi:glutathione-specific gamma-glutamylcyclotransferase